MIKSKILGATSTKAKAVVTIIPEYFGLADTLISAYVLGCQTGQNTLSHVATGQCDAALYPPQGVFPAVVYLAYYADIYVPKDATLAELTAAVTAEAGNYYHPSVQDQMLAYCRGKREVANTKSYLSKRELEVVREISVGGTSKDIADWLHLSEHPVRTHRRNVLLKLGVNNTAELVHLVMENQSI